MQTKSFTQTMSDGVEIWINRWSPDSDDEIKGVIQLHHGLAEHSMRYDRLGSILAENGYVLNAYDMRGHGQTAELAISKKTGGFGKLADKKGFDRAVYDLFEITNAVKNVYPGKKVILLAHSFGSFVGQSFIEQFGDKIDGCILSGSAGPRKMTVAFGYVLAKLVKLFKGADNTSKLLGNLSFGSYNKKINNPKTEYDWLTKNEMCVSMYQMDNWCGIPLTTSFYCDMLYGLKKIHNIINIDCIPKQLPVLLMYGSEDPVGSYGKTVKKLFEIYKSKKIEKAEIKEYSGDRHELLNETDCETVEKDIIDWVNKL